MSQADQRLSELAGSARQISVELHALLEGGLEPSDDTVDLLRDAAERLAGLASRLEQGRVRGHGR